MFRKKRTKKKIRKQCWKNVKILKKEKPWRGVLSPPGLNLILFSLSLYLTFQAKLSFFCFRNHFNQEEHQIKKKKKTAQISLSNDKSSLLTRVKLEEKISQGYLFIIFINFFDQFFFYLFIFFVSCVGKKFQKTKFLILNGNVIKNETRENEKISSRLQIRQTENTLDRDPH